MAQLWALELDPSIAKKLIAALAATPARWVLVILETCHTRGSAELRTQMVLEIQVVGVLLLGAQSRQWQGSHRLLKD